MSSRPRIFIDGEAGTTGLQLAERLARRTDLELCSIDPALRKDPKERKRLLNDVDVAVLCLPDDAAREAVAWIQSDSVKVLDASTAHRVHPDWTYGFAELSVSQRQAIKDAQRVSNPGCYPTGAISLLRPLIGGGALPAAHKVQIHAISGYSGGGRKLIDRFEHPNPEETLRFGMYGLSLAHKHVPEMTKYSHLENAPLFVPSVGNFKCGMLVSIALSATDLAADVTGQQLQRLLSDRYQGEPFVSVRPLNDASALENGYLNPEALNGTNQLELFVFENTSAGQIVLIARLDNLGKGASGAAVQNLNLMLGLPENADLESAGAAA